MTLKNYGARKGSVCSYRCYIEEYNDRRGRLCARVRDKRTNKHIVIGTKEVEKKDAFLEFLNSAKKNSDTMPDLYDRYGDDVIVVSGILKDEVATSILVDIDNDHGSYRFE